MKAIISFLIRYVPRPILQRISHWGLKAASVFYLGNKVQCPICSSRYRQFMPYGRVHARPNALCPNCLSLERHRLIWVYLQQRTHFFDAELQVLHIAPELCFVQRFEQIHRQNYVTADLESPWAQVRMDIHHMPFESDRFDAVLCNHVLEHVEDDIQALREIHRVLKPGGWAILQVPFFSPVPDHTFQDSSMVDKREREKLFGQADHVRKYGKDYAQRIAQSGLQVIEDDFGKTLTPDAAYRMGIARNEIIYIGIKK